MTHRSRSIILKLDPPTDDSEQRSMYPVADPGFSPGGGANSQKCYYFSIFCQKLHENERIWTPGGARVPGAPLGSANGIIIFTMQ